MFGLRDMLYMLYVNVLILYNLTDFKYGAVFTCKQSQCQFLPIRSHCLLILLYCFIVK